MNNTDKIRLIEEAIKNYDEERCPYCSEKLVPFVRSNKKAFGCDNHDPSIQISPIDFFIVVSNIVKYSMKTAKHNFKKLTEF